MKIFFSHSSRDKALLRELRTHLPSWLSPWIDEDELLFGADLELSLRRAIEEDVDYVVLFLGNEAIDSPFVRSEITWALAREQELGRTFLLPVMLVDVRDRLDELGLASRKALEHVDSSPDGTKLLASKISNNLAGWLCETVNLRGNGHRSHPANLSAVMRAALAEVPFEWRRSAEDLIVRPFLQELDQSKIGLIPLTPPTSPTPRCSPSRRRRAFCGSARTRRTRSHESGGPRTDAPASRA